MVPGRADGVLERRISNLRVYWQLAAAGLSLCALDTLRLTRRHADRAGLLAEVRDGGTLPLSYEVIFLHAEKMGRRMR